MTAVDIQEGGAHVIPLHPKKPSQNPASILGTAQCPCCSSALNTTNESVICVNGIWLTWRQRTCTSCGHTIDTTEIPANLAIDALKKGIPHA